MTPDSVQAIQNHHSTMAQWWKDPQYIIERKAFVKRNPFCARCGRRTTTPGHSPEDYKAFERYIFAVISDKTIPLCSACNLMERYNLKPCPECIKKYKIKRHGRIHYIRQESVMCIYCKPVEDA